MTDDEYTGTIEARFIAPQARATAFIDAPDAPHAAPDAPARRTPTHPHGAAARHGVAGARMLLR